MSGQRPTSTPVSLMDHGLEKCTPTEVTCLAQRRRPARPAPVAPAPRPAPAGACPALAGCPGGPRRRWPGARGAPARRPAARAALRPPAARPAAAPAPRPDRLWLLPPAPGPAAAPVAPPPGLGRAAPLALVRRPHRAGAERPAAAAPAGGAGGGAAGRHDGRAGRQLGSRAPRARPGGRAGARATCVDRGRWANLSQDGTHALAADRCSGPRGCAHPCRRLRPAAAAWRRGRRRTPRAGPAPAPAQACRSRPPTRALRPHAAPSGRIRARGTSG